MLLRVAIQCCQRSVLQYSKQTLKTSSGVQKTHPVREAIDKVWSLFNLESKLYLKYDKVPTGYEKVYSIGMDNFLGYWYLIGGAGAILAAASLIQLGSQYSTRGDAVLREESKKLSSLFKRSDHVELQWYHYAGLTAVLGFHVVMAIVFAKCVPLRVYYSKAAKDFCLVFQGKLPIQKRIVMCKPGEVKDVSVKDAPYFMPWKSMQYKLNGKTVFIYERYFVYPTHYNILCGYQKITP